jgi:hypothetical protein
MRRAAASSFHFKAPEEISANVVTQAKKQVVVTHANKK